MIKATYGHGTHNDFVLVFDENDQIKFTKEQIKQICDRNLGIGSDGFIKIVKKDGSWFMDYLNGDGSVAEMCGNGIRVMARYLTDRGHQPSGIYAINTRDGRKFLSVPESGDISVNMGQVSQVPGEILVTVHGNTFTGLNIDMGNPHAVAFVDQISQVGDLKAAPAVEPKDEYPEGVNVEFVEFMENGELKMRVHERGVGETQSCGTGTCAVALAATIQKRKSLPIKWVINAPGGRLVVDIDGHSNATLTGPAELVKEVELDQFL
ncbi:MAG: diaminopimelate epimerase [Candidatus Nanopelagicus sp.]